jgi:hypothetical protein
MILGRLDLPVTTGRQRFPFDEFSSMTQTVSDTSITEGARILIGKFPHRLMPLYFTVFRLPWSHTRGITQWSVAYSGHRKSRDD